MRLTEVKIGQAYNYWGNKVVAEEIEKVDYQKGSNFSGVICRVEKTGGTMKTAARYMIPWEEYQAERRINQLEQQRAEQIVEEIQAIIGEGVAPYGTVRRDYAYLFLTEKASDRLLQICGAKPIPEDRRPSLAQNDQEWIKRATLLGQRLRRALGTGYAGEHGGQMLHKLGKNFQAQIFFYDQDLEEVLKRIKAEEPEPTSTLSELLG